jgi:hypothetical protein
LLGLESWSAAAAPPEACAGPGAGAGREGGSVEEGEEAFAAPLGRQGRGVDMGGSTGRERKRDRQTGEMMMLLNVSKGHEKSSGGGREVGLKDTGKQSQTANVGGGGGAADVGCGGGAANVGSGGGAASGSTQGAVRGKVSKRSRHRHDGAPAGSGLSASLTLNELEFPVLNKPSLE